MGRRDEFVSNSLSLLFLVIHCLMIGLSTTHHKVPCCKFTILFNLKLSKYCLQTIFKQLKNIYF